MKNQMVFENGLIEVMENAMETTQRYQMDWAIPIVIFKGMIDLETSRIYDYLAETTFHDNSDIELAFEDILNSFGLIKEEDDEEEETQEEERQCAADMQQEEEPVEDIYEFVFDSTGEKVFYTKEVAVLLSKAVQMAEKKKSNVVKLEYLEHVIAENIPKDILIFLRNLGVSTKDFKDYFLQEDNEKEGILPKEVESFMRVLNEKYKKNTRCSILGRDSECETVWKTLQKKTKRNVILIGKPGVGKSSIAKKITHDIVNGNCPEEFKNYSVISVDVNATIAGTIYRGQAEERFQELVQFLEKTDNVILFIDEIHTILGAGACREGETDLANALKPILAEDKVRVIGATTSEEYEKYFSKDGALKRRFHPIEVKEPNSKEVYPMLKNAISDLSRYHGVKISKAMVEYIVLISSCFNHETSNPDRTIDLIDLSMVTAKMAGKTSVDKESILKNFTINFKKFEKMDNRIKKSTAYHEAGHYLVWKMSESLLDMEGIAISIMPANGNMGITIFDELRDEVTATDDMNYFIDEIAMALGGRVAEKMYTGTISSGASSDLERATKLAYALITKCGMTEDFGKNRSYFNDGQYTMYSEKVVDHVNAEIDKVIAKAYKRAEEILTENEVYLKKLVNQLMRKGIVSKKDLDRIFEGKATK